MENEKITAADAFEIGYCTICEMEWDNATEDGHRLACPGCVAIDQGRETYGRIMQRLMGCFGMGEDEANTLALAAEAVEELYLNDMLGETPFEEVAEDITESLSWHFMGGMVTDRSRLD
jgi:hypothetical protein